MKIIIAYVISYFSARRNLFQACENQLLLVRQGNLVLKIMLVTRRVLGKAPM